MINIQQKNLYIHICTTSCHTPTLQMRLRLISQILQASYRTSYFHHLVGKSMSCRSYSSCFYYYLSPRFSVYFIHLVWFSLRSFGIFQCDAVVTIELRRQWRQVVLNRPNISSKRRYNYTEVLNYGAREVTWRTGKRTQRSSLHLIRLRKSTLKYSIKSILVISQFLNIMTFMRNALFVVL